jgi:hypothetical protein
MGMFSQTLREHVLFNGKIVYITKNKQMPVTTGREVQKKAEGQVIK